MPEPIKEPEVKLPDGTPPADKAPGGKSWQEAFTELVKDRDGLKEKARAYDSELQAFRQKEAERAKLESKSKEEQEQQRLEQEGNYKQALKNAEDKWAQKVAEQQRVASERLVPMAIRAAASQVKGLSPQAIADLPKLVGPEIALNPETLEVFVRDPKTGKQMIDEKLNPVSVESYLAKFAEERPYLLIDNLPNRHGTSPGIGNGKTLTFEHALADRELMNQWEKTDPEGLKKAQAEYYNPKAALERAKAKMGVKS